MKTWQCLFREPLAGRAELFLHVAPEAIAHHLDACGEEVLPAGSVLLAPDQPNDRLYVILSGRVAVRLAGPDADTLIEFGPGACVGEMSMLEGTKPSAYVVAVADCHLLLIEHRTVWGLVNASHAVARNLLVTLLKRGRTTAESRIDSAVIMRQFKEEALTDPLTELYNRRGMGELFPREIERCQRSQRPACLIMADIDAFKDLNDRGGHVAGDRALSSVAHELRRHFRPTDLVARYGGDEFVVLLPEVDVERALKAAERVRVTVADARIAEWPTTVSMGVASMAAVDTLESLVDRADTALYRAKRSGRNRVSL